MQDLSDVARVLHRKRTVQPEFVQQPRATRGVHAALAGNVLDRVARNEMDQRKRQQRDADERRDDQREAAEDEAEHRPLTRLACARHPLPARGERPGVRGFAPLHYFTISTLLK